MDLCFAMLAGLLITYAGGAPWLGFFARAGADYTPFGLEAALVAGVYLFIVANLLKLLAGAGILPELWHLLGRTDTR